jgi:hypothetical protein
MSKKGSSYHEENGNTSLQMREVVPALSALEEMAHYIHSINVVIK